MNVTIRNLPTAVDDILALGNLSGPVTIPVLDNDLPGAGCSFLACTGCPGGQPCGVRIITPPLHGTAVVNPDCTVTYTPGASFGTDEQFCYELTNSCGCTDQACVQLTGCREVNRRTCASLLLYPEFDNRQSALTLYTIDNACCDLTTGTVLVEFRFIDKATCLETNRTFSLTPCDTISFLTSTVNPNSVEGYAYAYAKRSTAGPGNPNGEPIVFNHLIGQLLVIDGIEALDYSLNAVSFLGIGRKYEANDDDHDGIRDLNGPSSPLAEYEEAPDQILIPRFLGQDPAGPGALYNSSVILIALSGGSQFTTSIAVLGFNDSETVFSSAYSFRCWDKAPLRELAPFSLESFLDGVSNDPAEIVGAPAKESGWLLIDGDVAFSTAEEIVDPAVYAVLVERIGPLSVADLPFELCSQTNGDLLPNGPFGDGPNPVVGDNQ